jgi:hypothetical protein
MGRKRKTGVNVYIVADTVVDKVLYRADTRVAVDEHTAKKLQLSGNGRVLGRTEDLPDMQVNYPEKVEE